jgi:hypothetical protein
MRSARPRRRDAKAQVIAAAQADLESMKLMLSSNPFALGPLLKLWYPGFDMSDLPETARFFEYRQEPRIWKWAAWRPAGEL